MEPKSDITTANFPEDFPMIKPPYQPRLVLAHTDSVYAALSCRRFRRLGWDVSLVGTGLEARHLARVVRPDVVVLDVHLRDETGWLTCSKLVRECPGVKVILLGSDLRPESHRFALFVGASALVSQEDGIQALVDEVHGAVLAAAG
jgi:DNA-binding response OmpR family regulator